MTFWVSLSPRLLLLLLVLVAFCGCDPSPRTGISEEEKEPHYLAGKTRVNAMDYQGAIDSFERALESNPKSAAAHFELGWLFELKQPDPAAAIYHYEQFLKLRPKTEHADAVRQHILGCKQELARAISLGPLTQRQQQEMETMTKQIEALTQANLQYSNEVMALRIHLARSLATSNALALVSASSVAPSRTNTTNLARAASSEPSSSSRSTTLVVNARTPKNPPTGRTHIVKRGENPASIARQYGIRTDVLLSANPGLDPRKLRPGKELRIP